MFGKEKSSDERRFRVAPDVSTEVVGERASSAGVLLFSAVLFVVVLACVLGVGALATGRVTLGLIIVAALVALLAIGCCHIAQQWERVVVLRLGRFNRVSGPGLFWTIPVIESNTMRVDTRTRVTTFYAEETLTADLVPMNVDAVLFWHVWDAAAAALRWATSPAPWRWRPKRPCATLSAGQAPPRWPSAASSWIGSLSGCWRRRWRPGA